MSLPKRQETIGIVATLCHAALWGIFPVAVNLAVKEIAPITFAALTTLVAAGVSFIFIIAKNSFRELARRESYWPILMVTIFVVVVPSIFLFIGASKTSGLNTSMLLLSEIVFTLVFTHFIGEKTTKLKLLGAGGILLGALFILYNGTFKSNTGDLFIIAATLTYPIGNFYAKKALNLVGPEIVLFLRFILGGLILLLFGPVFDSEAVLSDIIKSHWPAILITGGLLVGLAKIIWYEGFRRLDISKTISLGMTFPLFSLIFILLFTNEMISLYQWIGIMIMLIGVYFSIKRKSVEPTLTKYAPIE